jgi:hypothetical protein
LLPASTTLTTQLGKAHAVWCVGQARTLTQAAAVTTVTHDTAVKRQILPPILLPCVDTAAFLAPKPQVLSDRQIYELGVYGAPFQQKFTLKDAIGTHACSLEAVMRVTKWHSSQVFTPLTG